MKNLNSKNVRRCEGVRCENRDWGVGVGRTDIPVYPGNDECGIMNDEKGIRIWDLGFV
jgi:hypothetical protein